MRIINRIGRIALVCAWVLLCALPLFAKGASEAPGAPAQSVQPGSTALKTPILWYLRAGIADVEDAAAVNAELNRVLATKGFNAGVQVEFINRPDYNTRMQLINTSNEPYDLALTTESWVNIYTTNVNNEFFLDLSNYQDPSTGKTVNLIKEYAPGLWASIPEATWNAAKYNGGIHAVINQQIYTQPRGLSIRTDVMQALGLKDAVDAVRSWEDLTPIMERIQQAIRSGELASKVQLGQNLQYAVGTIDLVSPLSVGYESFGPLNAVMYDDASATMVNWYETKEFKDLATLRRSWIDKGLAPSDDMDLQTLINGYKSGLYVMDVARVVKPGGDVEQKARMGLDTDWYEVVIGPNFVSTSGPTGTMTGVSSLNEKDPQRVKAIMRFLELVHTDQEIYNLIAKGIEGKHWNWVDKDAKLIQPVSGSGYNPNIDWAIGNQFNAYYINAAQVGAWEATKKLNDSAVASVSLGFRPDMTEINSELASIASIVKEFADPITKGLVADVDSAIAKLNENLKRAGSQKVYDYVKSQFDTWKNSR